ncbi:MAG TPA: TIR-like protein FxsC [Streptosporangiaceae bacterium]|nr:TIR-like protein FxsC [Streptosporangiaceae bacterium]
MSAGQDVGPVSEAPYFFLSYARTPKMPDEHGDPDRWIAKLYGDLCRHVVMLTSGRSAEVGFMDRGMRVGAQWPSRLAHALACCRVFVPLYSPRYFESEECGKEWSAFSQRMRNQAVRRGDSPMEAIVPALWVPVEPGRMPSAARSIQFSHHSLGARYSEEGFWGIMKISRYRNDYEVAVLRLARHIVQAARQTMLDRDSPVDYQSLTSAFEHRISPGEQRPPDTAEKGGRRIRIVIAAPTTQDMPEGRRGLGYYGASEHDWNPYHPESQAPLGDYAADLTARLGYRPMVVPFSELPGAKASEAAPAAAGAPGLFLVDPWAAATDGQAARLREFDERAERWISLLIPWNRADGETMAAEATLQSQMGETLSHMLDRTPPEYRHAANRIPTLADFANILPTMTRIADNRFLRDARAYPPSGPAMSRPMLLGPYPPDSEGMQ